MDKYIERQKSNQWHMERGAYLVLHQGKFRWAFKRNEKGESINGKTGAIITEVYG